MAKSIKTLLQAPVEPFKFHCVAEASVDSKNTFWYLARMKGIFEQIKILAARGDVQISDHGGGSFRGFLI